MATLTAEQEIELQAIFNEGDKDANERLDAKELMLLAQRFGLNPRPEDVESTKAKHDVNNDGTVDFEEFKTLICDLYTGPEEREHLILDAMKTIYQNEDMGEDTKLTKQQFLEIFQKHGSDPLTAEEVDEIFIDLDKDGDTDTITKEEIAALLNS